MDNILVSSLPPGCWLGQGKGAPNWIRKNGRLVDANVEHSSGNAQDIMVVPRVGQRANQEQRAKAFAIINWCIRNAKAIGLRWIIFDYYDDLTACSYNPSRGSWKRLYKGGVSEAHADHVHIYLDSFGDFRGIDMAPLRVYNNRKEVDDMTVQELHAELNENPMLSLIASRIGALLTITEKMLPELIEEIRQLHASVR
jgi:hypothetical protein